MRFFRSEIEMTLKIMGIAALISLILLPVAWGYEQRQQARTWQNIACAYRIKEVARQTPMIASVEYRRDACVALSRLRPPPSRPPGQDCAGKARARTARAYTIVGVVTSARRPSTFPAVM